MSFRPKNSGGNRTEGGEFESRANLPVPKAGLRKARVSLIIDLGVQDREDFEDEKTKEKKPRKPCQQVAVFADLVSDVVDYGGKIGEQQYRIPVNNVFKGVMEGINFYSVPPTDADGNRIEGKPWGLHPRSKLTAIAKAIGKEEIAIEGKHPEAMDISLLLDEPFMAQVEVKETPDKNGKKDANGKLIVYKNVNYKGAAPVPTIEDEEGEEKPMPVAKLRQKPLCITFDDAKTEDIQFIRPSLIKVIKQANNYAGSQMQKAIEAYEAANGAGSEDDAGEEEEQKPASKPAAKKPAEKKKPASAPVEEEEEQDVPF